MALSVKIISKNVPINKFTEKLCGYAKYNKRHKSLFRKSKEMEHEWPYIIQKARKEDHLNILNVMHEAYYYDEPTTCSLGVSHNSVLDQAAMGAMSNGMTFVAKCKYDGCIVGAAVNEATHPWDPDVKEKMACEVVCPKLRQLLLFYAYVQRMPDIWNKYGVQKVYEMAYIFVKKEHRKQGIALRLLQTSKELAADCGYGVVRCDATSAYTARLCEKLMMEKIAEIPYCSYMGRNLEPVFQPPHPHEIVKIYADPCPQLRKTEKEAHKSKHSASYIK